MHHPIDMRPEPMETLEVREETVAARYSVLDALQRKQGPMTDAEVAAATGRDLESIRGAITHLADAQMIELISETEASADPWLAAPSYQPSVQPSMDRPRLICRLAAI